MKILITGGCGYIGSALYLQLSKNHQVDTVDLEWFGNFVNPNNIRKDFSILTQEFIDRYDAVIHVAANSSVPMCGDIFDSFDNNVTKFVGLVKKLKRQKFIYASSSCVYVESGTQAKTEDDQLMPTDGLTLSKTTIDHLMPLTGVEYYGLRFGSVNGWSPNLRLDLIINSMTMSALRNRQVNVFNSHADRPVLSIVDLVRAVKTIVENPTDKRGVYNVASVNHNIGEIGARVAKHLRVDLVDHGANSTYDFTISSSKFEQEFDFKFEGTIESIVDDILGHEANPKWQKREAR